MTNGELAAVFREMSDLLRIEGGDRNRARAFKRTAEIVEAMREPVSELLKYGRLAAVKGIGPGSIERIKEILRTGTCSDRERLRRAFPVTLLEMLDLKGLGPNHVREIWRTLGVATLDQLAIAAHTGQLLRVPGIGDKTAEQVAHELARRARAPGRILLPDAIAISERLVAELSTSPAVLRVMATGSVRRRQETIGDLDFVCASTDRPAVSARFATLSDVDEVLMQARTRASVRLSSGTQADIWIVPPECWGAGLHAFSGNQPHIVAMRKRAGERGLSISEDGIFPRDKRGRIAPGTDEVEIFHALGLPFIVPELRQNSGEIEAADKGRLPHVLELEQLRGAMSLHTQAGDGEATARQMMLAARAAGCSWAAIVDVPRAVRTAEDWRERRATLRALEDDTGLGVLCGVVVDVDLDGELSLPPEVTAEVDLVVARLVAPETASGEALTAAVEAALSSGRVDVLARPTGRVLHERPPLPIDLERVMKAARRHDVAMQLCADPRVLDLDERGCRLAKEMGVPVVIDSWAHAPDELARVRYGVWTARRGWLTARDALNARDFGGVQDFLAQRRGGRPGGGRALPARAERPRLQAPAAAPEPQILSLEEILRTGDLDPALAERLDRWLREGDDLALERALSKVSGNAMQKAFELVVAARQNGLLSDT
jgi:DNA polymerase (family 10)